MIANPKTPLDRLLWALQFGHAWNRDPKYANLRNLDHGRVLMMTGDEADAKLLLASWQDFEPNVERLVAALHGRQLEPDGEVGPATEIAMSIKRCAMPDFAPPPGAELSMDTYDVPELLGAVESYQRYADYKNDGKDYVGRDGSWHGSYGEPVPANAGEYVGGSGSWRNSPTELGCDPLRRDVHSKTCNVIQSGFSSHQRGLMAEILKALERCEAEQGMALRHILDGDPAKANHDLRGQNIPGNVIGFNYFPRENSCQLGLVGRIDNSFNASKYALAELYTHEKDGHGDGAEHRNRTSSKKSIMHPAIGNPNDWPTWRGDAHEDSKRRWFGGVPVPGSTPTDPVPVPTSQKVWIRNAPGMIAAQDVVAVQDFSAKAGQVLGQFYYKSA